MDSLAVVSGGGTGIGRAVAAMLATAGSDVIIIGRREQVVADAATELNQDLGGRHVSALAADLRDPAQVRHVAARLTEGGREIHVLVNNAGGNFAPDPPTDLERVRDSWLVNMTGNVLPTVLLTHALLPTMRKPGGRIITISSIAAFRGPASYGGAKAALHPWAVELAGATAADGITVNVVAPGYVTGTEFYRGRMSKAFHAGRAGRSPMNRGATTTEVAATVAHLAGPDAGFLTGQIIQINGGALMGRG
jgi:3-oxoacyl-[acyl-carrier protein] reductase